jgi:hypothetical protein
MPLASGSRAHESVIEVTETYSAGLSTPLGASRPALRLTVTRGAAQSRHDRDANGPPRPC